MASQELLLNAIHKQLDHGISYNLWTGIAYGMFLTVYCISIRILLSRGSLLNSPGHMFVFAITTVIFILATTVLYFGPDLTTQGIPFIIRVIDPSIAVGWSPHKLNVVVGVIAVISRLNPVLSDVVCAWRAMVLWKYDRRVIALLSVCVLGTFAGCIYDVKLALEVKPGTNEQNLPQGKLAVVIVAPMLGTNVLSTSLIAWKAWEIRQVLGTQIRKGSTSERVEKILALLIESGFVYCLLWSIYLMSAYGVLPGAGAYIVNIDMLLLSSMYPAIIIIIVCMQISQDAYTTRNRFTTRQERTNGFVLTTVELPVGATTVESSQFSSQFTSRGKTSTMDESPC
ncbi:hypothetical protein BGY98DRAFT_992487 [Russula aff. rugulosa BPL654]|nr:hypothetical protein BGY98DRAFT_992487 [Russula aff. rugulosa BPL654]